jgi:structural maintenance of chromosome 3 (chondroitin sulfate proteoglycan 6)
VRSILATIDQQINETDDQIENLRSQLIKLEESRAEKEASNGKLAKVMEKHESLLARKDTDRSRFKAQLEEVRKDIRNLGTLPEDVDRKYSRWDATKVCI